MDEITQALSIVKALVSAGKLKAEDINTMISLQEKLYSLMFENKDLKERIGELESQLEEEAKTVNKKGAIYALDDEGVEYGPICPLCYKNNGISAILFDHAGTNKFRCNTCRKIFDKQHAIEMSD